MPIKGTGLLTITEVNESYSALLSSEAVTITTDSSGQNPSMNGASTTVLLMLGTKVVTAYIPTAATLNASYVSGCKVLVSGTTVSFDGGVDSGTGLSKLTADTGYVDIPVYSNAAMTSQYLVATKRFSFAKSKTGAQGPSGGAGAPGSSYVLNISGGTRSITYAADGTTPTPSTGGSFTYTLYKSGVSVASGSITSVTWSVTGALSGSSTSKTTAFQPTVQAQYNSATMANSSVTATVVCDGNTIVTTVPVAVQKDATGLDWVNEWNNGKTVVGGTYLLTPKLFAGVNDTNGMTGIAIGRDVVANTDKLGLFGYHKNQVLFSLNPNDASGNVAVFGVNAGKQLIIKNDGSMIVPDISADNIKGGALQLGGNEYIGFGGSGNIYNEWGDLVTTFNQDGTRIRFFQHTDELGLPEFEKPFLVTEGKLRPGEADFRELLSFTTDGNTAFAGGLVSRNVDTNLTKNDEIIMHKNFLSFHRWEMNHKDLTAATTDHYSEFSVLSSTPGLRLTSSTGQKRITGQMGHGVIKGLANDKDKIVFTEKLSRFAKVDMLLQVGMLLVDAQGKLILDAAGKPQIDQSKTFVQGTDYKLTVVPATTTTPALYYIDWSPALANYGAAAALHQPPTGYPYGAAYQFSTASVTGMEGFSAPTNTVLGYMDIGVKDASAAYIETDRPVFKFNKKLEVTGAVEVKSSNALSFVDYGGGFNMTDTTWIRTTGSKGFYHNAGTMRTDGTFHVGANGDTLNVPTGGNFAYRTNVLFANTTGNVGIGTATPSKKLHVAGDAYIVPTGVGITIDRVGGQSSIKAGSANSGYLMLDSSGAGTGALGLNWYTSDNVILVNGGGKVGVGTTSPLRTLDVGGELRVSGSLIYGGSSYLGFVTDSGGALPMKMGSLAITSSYSNSAPTNGMYVQGSVGIGTTSPSYPLHVVGDIYNTGWIRTTGNTGIYFESYGGGWNMSDTTWVRAYNGKSIYTSGVMQADGGVTVNSGKRVIDSNGNLETLDTVRYGTAASTKYNSTTKSIDFIFN
jgi:hypothetical protein